MSTSPKFKTKEDAKKAGWFSRRHQTNAEHLIAREKLKRVKVK